MHPCAGALAAALLCGGLQPGLLVLEWLLWDAGLPIALPYAAMAALLRWQLRCTALMWRVMRGKQRMTPLRHRLAALWLAARGCSGTAAGSGPPSCGAAGAGDALFVAPRAAAAEMASFAHSPGSGLKQLCGSMLLFMPLLLLLPTTAWFYGLALALHVTASAPRAATRLARQLARQDPLGAALSQLLGKRPSVALSGNGTGYGDSLGGAQYARYTVLEVRFAGAAAAPPSWMQQAVAATAHLEARPRQCSPWQAALRAAGGAWHECDFASVAPALGAVLCGKPLFLAPPARLGSTP